MEREIRTTGDGSHTFYIPELNEQYHSKHGAIAEAKHVYIEAGLLAHKEKNPGVAKTAILEIGFGTGLNALLTLLEAEKTGPKIHYTGIDAFPLPIEEAEKLNYPQQLKIENGAFRKLHNAPWGASTAIGERFILTKQHKRASEIGGDARFNLIYFDAFGPRAQPALWTVSIFEHMYRALQPKGTLVTYSAKGSVRRAMGAVGFVTERLPGPPGKREMLRATKH